MRAPDLLDHLAAHGRISFTTEEARALLGSSEVATASALRRLRAKGHIATPRRGFHVTVPPEYRALGCRPAAHFVPELMSWLGRPYYVGLLSAAAMHGAAHQAPQVFQVVTDRRLRPVVVGRVRVDFIGRANVDQVPTSLRNTAVGQIRLSTPEQTALDLVGHTDHAGGLDHVATVLSELSEVMGGSRLADVAPLSPVAWSQRLGYLLEHIRGDDMVTSELARWVASQAPRVVALEPGAEVETGRRSARWQVRANVEPQVDEL